MCTEGIVFSQCCICPGHSVASGLNRDFDSSSTDRQNGDILPPPVVLSVASETDLLSSSADAVSSYIEPSLSDVHLGTSLMDIHTGGSAQDVTALAAEFYIPPPNLLTASGYLGSHGSLPEVCLYAMSGKNIPNIIDQHLKKRYPILVIFNTDVSGVTGHQMTVQYFISPSVCFCTT